MVGVNGEIFRKRINKNIVLVLEYDWESYEYGKHRKTKYSGTLQGDGETVLIIAKEKSFDGFADDYEIDKLFVYHGGGDLNFNLKENIPKEVIEAWEKEILKNHKNKT